MSQETIITRRITPEDIPALAAIHKAAYREDHFSAHFSPALLAGMYTELCRDNPFALVATDRSGQVLGFVVGQAAEAAALAKHRFTASHSWPLAVASLRNPAALARKIRDRIKLALGGEHFTSQARMRLTSIAVSPQNQQKSVGKALLETFEAALHQAGISLYGLSVRGNNLAARRFYQKHGFEVERETPEGAIYYVKRVDSSSPPAGQA